MNGVYLVIIAWWKINPNHFLTNWQAIIWQINVDHGFHANINSSAVHIVNLYAYWFWHSWTCLSLAIFIHCIRCLVCLVLEPRIVTITYSAFLRRAKRKTWRVCEAKTKNLKGLWSKNNLPYLRCNTHRNLWCTTHR